MTTLSGRARWLAPSVTVALALGVVGVLAVPASAATTTFTQDTDVIVGDDAFAVGNDGPITIDGFQQGSPYPSEIVVTQAATIVDVNVELEDITHAVPDQIDVLLVGPGGQQSLLMSDVGGSNALTSDSITLDDDAAGSLPDSGVITDLGEYKPTNFGNTDGPLPPAPVPNFNTQLSVFDGTSAAGTWQLFVHDDTAGTGGSIGGWSLEFELATTPYPSTISVAGVGTVSDVNVTLHGITSGFPADTDILLTGPGGQQATLMSDVGSGYDIDDLTLTLDDEAAQSLPDAAQIVAGTYKPTNLDGAPDIYPDPAPVATGATLLSTFDGIGASGEWRLFARDDQAGYVMSLTGWSLEITWTDNLVPTGTVNVNGGSASTSSQNVTLNLSANDPAPATGVTQMRFSNDGVTFSGYQAYAATAAWTLSAGDGAKTVYAQFKDSEGNQSAVASDGITLALPDTTGPKATKTKPANKAKSVKVTTKVKVTVSEALLAGSVNKNTVVLRAKGSSKKVKAKVTYNVAKKKITLTPNKALKKNTKYKVTVTSGVKDVAGNAFDAKPAKADAQALRFSFTTG